MQNAKCKMQNNLRNRKIVLYLFFWLLNLEHFELYQGGIYVKIFIQTLNGYNRSEATRHFAFCTLHFAFKTVFGGKK